MPRALRADYAGEIYHALNRGNARHVIERDSFNLPTKCLKAIVSDDHQISHSRSRTSAN